jgi:hypothetical protein
MAIAVVQVFRGGTLEQYDRVIESLNFTPGGQGAPGGLFHWVTETDGDVRITDVWDSREAFEAFARDKIGPAKRPSTSRDRPRSPSLKCTTS